MRQNAYSLAKIGADTAEYERKFAEHFAKNWQLPYGRAADLHALQGAAEGRVRLRLRKTRSPISIGVFFFQICK